MVSGDIWNTYSLRLDKENRTITIRFDPRILLHRNGNTEQDALFFQEQLDGLASSVGELIRLCDR